MCKTSCVPCCGEEKPFDLLRGRGTFSPRIEQLAIHKQNTNRRRCELSFCKLFVLWPCEHTHTHTHAFTQTHTRRGRHADILYQCVHTPLGPNDAYKMQQQQFSAFFLNGNFFAVQQPSPPTICPPLPRIFQPHWSAFLLLLPRRAHYMESAFPLFVIVVDVFLLFCHCPHKNALILSSEKIKNVDMNAAWGNKIW